MKNSPPSIEDALDSGTAMLDWLDDPANPLPDYMYERLKPDPNRPRQTEPWWNCNY